MKETFTRRTLRVLLGMVAATSALSACGGNDTQALPPDVKSILILQRTPRADQGNVFDYTSYAAGGRLVLLSPPSADGKLSVLFDKDVAGVEGIDIQSYDLSFDAKSVVFSASLAGASYQLFAMNLDGSNLRQLTSGGNDYVYPTFLPGGQILFMTNENVEADTPQFRDEYERQTTAQVGTMAADGTGQVLGARNVSHRVSPAVMPDGSVAFTEWRHMGGVNDGHIRAMNTDMTGMRELFGGEEGGAAGTNSYLKARYVQTTAFTDPTTGQAVDNHQMIAIATSRDRTLQSGKLFLINLNGSEANSTFTDLTPLIPGDRAPSAVGRYYDAEAVDGAAGKFLVSWSDGPVESEALATGHSNAQFGIYVFDLSARNSPTGGRYPIFDAPDMWDVLARPVRKRAEPIPTTTPIAGTDTTIGALNVYNSSVLNIPAGEVVKVRLLEGFSGEEGGIDMFGSTEFDGQSRYGEVPVNPDNSFAAVVPGNVPFHIQLIDKFALNIANESIWISGRGGEQRFCGGCHENRTESSVISPGVTQNVLRGAVNLVTPRAQRLSTTAYQLAGGNLPTAGALAPGDNAVRGVPWDKAIQPIFNAKCVSCHGPDNKAGVPSYTVTDMTTMTTQTFNFDLSGTPLAITVGEDMASYFTTSYISVMGLGEMLGENVVQITGNPGITGMVPASYVSPGSATDSEIIKMLNPPQRFPSVNMTVRKFPLKYVPPQGTSTADFAADHASVQLTADEYYLLILNIDMGGQFFFRENLDSYQP